MFLARTHHHHGHVLEMGEPVEPAKVLAGEVRRQRVHRRGLERLRRVEVRVELPVHFGLFIGDLRVRQDVVVDIVEAVEVVEAERDLRVPRSEERRVGKECRL